MNTIAIYHRAGMGPTEYLVGLTGIADAAHAIRAALYCQFRFEELFPNAQMPLTNRDIAVLLAKFYGYAHAPQAPDNECFWIDMYSQREASCGPRYEELMLDQLLHRAELDQRLEVCEREQAAFLASTP